MIFNQVKNYTKGRNGFKIQAIVLHITDGSARSALSWFNTRRSYASAHYLVSPRAPHVMQLVRDFDTAWHCGKVVRPTWPGLVKGQNPNQYTLGIEVALRNDTVMPTWRQWVATVRLVKSLAKKYNIPLNKYGIVNHREIHSGKSCPGRWLTRFYILALMSIIN